jgi:hypothetical protein
MKFEEINDYDSLYFPDYSEWVVVMSKDEDDQTVNVMLDICTIDDNYKYLYNINPSRLYKEEKMEEKYFVIKNVYDNNVTEFNIGEESKMLKYIDDLIYEEEIDIDNNSDDLIVIRGKRVLLENKTAIKGE